MILAKDDKKNKILNGTLVWSLILCLIEIVLIWGLASQFSYLIYVVNDSSGTHVFLVIGVIITAIITILTMGIVAIRASERWGNERCRKMMGVDARLMNKSEVFIISIIVLSTLIGTGAWDMVTTLNALMANSWNLDVFHDDYLVFDLILFKIIWPLWLHTVVGGSKAILGIIIAFVIGYRVRDGSFCEI